jgi:diguanylate cyclase (GGDEF)-like protein/PAS domain S-box-containing protein
MSDLHRLLQRQLRKATRRDGSLDLDDLLRRVSLTYAEDEEDSRRTDRSIQLMVGEIEDASRNLTHTSEQLRLTLESVQHGIMMIDARARIHVCNTQARELLALPPEIAIGSEFQALVRWFDRFAVLGVEDGAATIAVSDELFVEIHVRPTAQQGCVVVVEDVTSDRMRERALRQAEAEYRSLFDNSVHGIYRHRLDGTQVRANRALAQFNGFADEAEQLTSSKVKTGSWYIDPHRAAEFKAQMERDGRVSDFVSQVRRHANGEPVWITENAWYVRDADGNPVFIEGTIQDASERIAAQEAMTRLANIDALTGAKSRFRFMERLAEEVARPGNRFVLYCIDLDMFKDVNDVFGHAAGDAVLQSVTQRLFRLVNNGEMVARLGGDEFAILSSDDSNLEQPESLARAIVEAMRVAVPVEGRNHYVGASVGIALYPAHGAGAEDLLRSADMALYEAKAAGRNGWHLFDSELRERLEHRKRLEDELRGALDRDEIDLHFQPIMKLDGQVAGFESLMRWRHPQLGNVPPAVFIPIAEKSGLMGELGSFAISRACEAISLLPKPIKVGVNVSANQFRMPGFLPFLQRELTRFDIDPGRLTLEITESVLVESEKIARTLLGNLRKLGVRIAIDDFGTGYSSLSYLQHFPINTVKIDRSFVAGMAAEKANMAVIRAVIGIGRELDIKVVAEGIETEAQAEVLRREGCQLLQGYLYGKPKPLADAVADLAIGLLGQAGATAPLRKTA